MQIFFTQILTCVTEPILWYSTSVAALKEADNSYFFIKEILVSCNDIIVVGINGKQP